LSSLEKTTNLADPSLDDLLRRSKIFIAMRTSNSEMPERLKDERKEHRRVVNTPRVERTERLEGSRFVAWQLYGLLAGGSRERLDVRQFYGPLDPHNRIAAMGKTLRWVIPGSRLLLTDRAAIW
jgi:hypothetical protein